MKERKKDRKKERKKEREKEKTEKRHKTTISIAFNLSRFCQLLKSTLLLFFDVTFFLFDKQYKRNRHWY